MIYYNLFTINRVILIRYACIRLFPQVLKKTKTKIAAKFPYVDAALETSDAFKFLVNISRRKDFIRKDVGTAIFMMGGCRIERNKRTKVTNWVKRLVGDKIHFYYLAYGAKTDVPFWTNIIYKYNIQTRTMGTLRWFKGFMADVMSVMKKKGALRSSLHGNYPKRGADIIGYMCVILGQSYAFFNDRQNIISKST
jgi:hypothetical protein